MEWPQAYILLSDLFPKNYDMNQSCHICHSSCHIEILLKPYRSGSKVLGTPRKVVDGLDRFPEQSGSSQTDPKGQDVFEFSRTLGLFSTMILPDP